MPEKNDTEEVLLPELFNTNTTSRLACQIYLTTEMDGLAIEIAAD